MLATARTRTAKARNNWSDTRFALAFIGELQGSLFENLLDIPKGFLSTTLCEQTYDEDEPLLMPREAAFRLAAHYNAQAKPEGIYGYWLWHVVVEIENRTKWTNVTMDEDGNGMLDIHDVPFRLVKPTAAERAEIGQREGGAT